MKTLAKCRPLEKAAHGFFLDEMKVFTTPSGPPDRQFAGWSGCIMSPKEHGWLQHDFEAIKSDFFHPRVAEPIVFHRVDINARKGPFKALRSAIAFRGFCDRVFEALAKAEFQVTGVVTPGWRYLDKSNWVLLAKADCLPFVVTDYCQWLTERLASGSVPIEASNRADDDFLKAKLYDLYHCGWPGVQPASLYSATLSRGFGRFHGKEQNVAGLQLADLLAAPIAKVIIRSYGSRLFGTPIPHSELVRLGVFLQNRSILDEGLETFVTSHLLPDRTRDDRQHLLYNAWRFLT